MDDKLTQNIQEYLNMTPKDRDVLKGAEMLLSLNRNAIFYQKVIRKPQMFADQVAYQLKKYLQIRLDRQTVKDVVRMNATVIPAAKIVLEEGLPVLSAENDIPQNGTIAKGMRADHNELPDRIKSLWAENAENWYKIKVLFEQLKGMTHATSCERYEYLKQLDELEKRYRANMKEYDNFKLGDEIDGNSSVSEGDIDVAEMAKKVSAARKYLSDNKSKLVELKGSDDKKFLSLLQKVQDRYDFLVSSGNTVSDDQVQELAELGVNVIK